MYSLTSMSKSLNQLLLQLQLWGMFETALPEMFPHSSLKAAQAPLN